MREMEFGKQHTRTLSPGIISKSPRAIIPSPSLITPPIVAVRDISKSLIFLPMGQMVSIIISDSMGLKVEKSFPANFINVSSKFDKRSKFSFFKFRFQKQRQNFTNEGKIFGFEKRNNPYFYCEWCIYPVSFGAALVHR